MAVASASTQYGTATQISSDVPSIVPSDEWRTAYAGECSWRIVRPKEFTTRPPGDVGRVSAQRRTGSAGGSACRLDVDTGV
jgi:hypothetical protein